MQRKGFLPLAAMEKVIKNAGASRVSDRAKSALKECVEEAGLGIAIKATKYAMHSGRKTIKSKDIELALK